MFLVCKNPDIFDVTYFLKMSLVCNNSTEHNRNNICTVYTSLANHVHSRHRKIAGRLPQLGPWVWSLHQRGVQDLCCWRWVADVDLLASSFNNKLERYRDVIMEAVDVLVSLWNQNTLISMTFPLETSSSSASKDWATGHSNTRLSEIDVLCWLARQ